MRIRGSRSSKGFIGLNAARAESLESGILGVNNAFSNTSAWIRPSNWLPMPSMTAGDQKIALLAAVYPAGRTGNALGATAAGTLLVVNASKDYIVDWGNGLTEFVDAGRNSTRGLLVKYNDLPESTTVTGQMAIGADGIPNAGYRQILVQMYPSVAGATFDRINVGIQTVLSGVVANLNTLATTARPKWLSIKGSSNTLTSLTIGGQGSGLSSSPYLREFEWIGSTSLTNCSNLFNGCTQLASIKGTEWCSNGQNFDAAFANCSRLKELPLLDTRNASGMSGMFSSCISLESIPHLDTRNVTNFSSMFFGCSALKGIPAFSTTNATNMSSMFAGCLALIQVPQLDTKNVTNFTSMFSNTSALEYVPPLNTEKGVTLNSMFSSSGIKNLYPLNLIQCNSLNNTFQSCPSISQLYLYNWDLNPSTKSTAFTITNCHNLSAIKINCGNIPSATFIQINPIRELILEATNLNSNNSSITLSPYCRRAIHKGIQSTFDILASLIGGVTGQCLSSEALNEMYRNLPTVGASGSNARAIKNIKEHWGYNESLTGIAASKGWNVG
jgi:surface protein